MEAEKQNSCSRREILPAFLAVLAGATVLFVIMNAVQPMLAGNQYIYGFGEMMAGCAQGSIEYYVAWFFADLTEGSFIASMPATIGLVVMAFVAAALERRNSRHAGSGVDGAGNIFTRMVLATFVALILGQVAFDWLFATGWIPTFAAVLTVQAFIIFYGTSWKKLVTIVFVGTFATFVACWLVLTYVVAPLGLPLFVAVSIGVAIVVPVCSAVYKLMPWMAPEPGNKPAEAPTSERFAGRSNTFFVHRVFGDIGNLVIWGSSYATIGMYVGAIISWIMNPLHPVYGSGALPLLIFAQIVTVACAIFIWWPKWKNGGWAFTFAGAVFVSAIICTYPGIPVVIIPTMIIGAVVFAPLVEWVLKVFRFKGSYHPIALIQVAIFSVCTLWSFVVMYGILPLVTP